MNKKIQHHDLIVALVILGSIILSSFGVIPVIGGVILAAPVGTETDADLPPVFGPEAARHATLTFIVSNYGENAPIAETIWVGGEIPTDGGVGSSTYQYVADDWVVRISFPIVAPGAIVYTVKVQGKRMTWEGLVDAYGQVATTTVSFVEPTATQIPPTPTNQPTSTSTSIPPTSTPTRIPPIATPVPVPCNAISFQADVTIADGTIFAPNADFKKTWQLKNIGSCSWTSEYNLVFVDGDRMSGKKAITIPEKIRPGEALNISVELTSPQEAGDYRGYWMLRSGSGEWFGYGKAASKAFWVDIEVVKPRGDYTYDFALNMCAAVWRSEDMRLPCPGYTTSEEGFVQLLDSPKLENRNEDELALWVHPNEERYGWLNGTYPTFKVQEGDHFKSWVGCLEGYGKCSLKFYLDYEDEDGKVRRLGEWIEEYDGEVTIIDFDLSELADKSVHFILGVEAITKNVDDAQGFWFVPVIDRDEE